MSRGLGDVYKGQGKHIERDDLGKQDVAKWIVETVEDLLPLYEACHGK